MRNFPLFPFFALALALPAVQLPARAAGELPRAGAPRPLRLVDSTGTPLAGSPRDVTWEARGGGLFFTLEREGTRNIWRAFPDPQDTSRFPAWRALPVTTLRAPRFAAQPALIAGGQSLVCVSNALAKAPATSAISQVVRYDLQNSQFRALSDSIVFYDSPQVSPDGTRVVFTGGRGAQASVYQASPQNSRNSAMPSVQLIANRARRPLWLDDNKLLVESLNPQARGLYWTPANPAANAEQGDVAAANVVIGGGGEANLLGADGLVFSAVTNAQAPTNLYVIARDGSGLRVLAETKNARRPAVSPDGGTLAYDAPQGNERALWIMPLLRVENRAVLSQIAPRFSNSRPGLCAETAPEYDGPSVALTGARATDSGIAIIGHLRGATDSNVNLEVGQGGKPKKWESLKLLAPAETAPADAQGNRVLGIWNSPTRARGDWTLRLSLRGLGGGAQSLLRLRLPLPITAPIPPPPAILPIAPPKENATGEDTNVTGAPATTPLPRATPLPEFPEVTPVRGPLLPTPAPSGDDLPTFPTMQAPESAPIPSSAAPKPPVKAPTTAGVQIVPIDPALLRPASDETTALISMDPIPVAQTPDGEEDETGYGERPDAPASAPFVAQFDVAGTPARMAPREKVKVTLRAINRGAATWQTGGSGADRVRVVVRWVDFSTGTRRQWNFFWLQQSVAPGERTTREFDVPAPARPGKYKLIYGLVHLPASGEYQPPPFSAPQENWDDEFGAIAFAVEVGPN